MLALMHVDLHIKWRLRCSDLNEKVFRRILHYHLSRNFVQPFLGCNLYIRRCADARCEVNGSVFAKYCELAECYVLTVYSQKSITGFFLRPYMNGGDVLSFFFTAAVFKPIK
jgi:hypothetical protein